MASQGEECEGDEGFGSWHPSAIRGSNRILLSALDSWGVGFDEHRSCAAFESLPTSPTGPSVIPG